MPETAEKTLERLKKELHSWDGCFFGPGGVERQEMSGVLRRLAAALEPPPPPKPRMYEDEVQRLGNYEGAIFLPVGLVGKKVHIEVIEDA